MISMDMSTLIKMIDDRRVVALLHASMGGGDSKQDSKLMLVIQHATAYDGRVHEQGHCLLFTSPAGSERQYDGA